MVVALASKLGFDYFSPCQNLWSIPSKVQYSFFCSTKNIYILIDFWHFFNWIKILIEKLSSYAYMKMKKYTHHFWCLPYQRVFCLWGRSFRFLPEFILMIWRVIVMLEEKNNKKCFQINSHIVWFLYRLTCYTIIGLLEKIYFQKKNLGHIVDDM